MNKKFGNQLKIMKVYCIELDKFWDCINDCAKELGLMQQSISQVCRGRLKTTGGYHFEYLKEKN